MGNRAIVELCKLGCGCRGHDSVAEKWSTCVKLDDRTVYIALSAPPPDLEVPPPATACCGPIWSFEGGWFIWKTSLRLQAWREAGGLFCWRLIINPGVSLRFEIYRALFGGKVAGLIWIRFAAEVLWFSFAKLSQPPLNMWKCKVEASIISHFESFQVFAIQKSRFHCPHPDENDGNGQTGSYTCADMMICQDDLTSQLDK